MHIAFATDEDGPLAGCIVDELVSRGHVVAVLGRPVVWPEAGRRVGEAVSSGDADRGVVCCWTGTGVSIAANKVKGVRAALCGDAVTARGARRWNDANVLALSIRTTTPALVEEILDAFLGSDPDPGDAELLASLE